jgi:hypothetical protein
MNTPTLEEDIERGLQIQAQIKELQAELKEIETRVQAVAEQGRQVPLKEQDREGKKFPASGRSAIVPVIFESDLIIGSFAPDSPAHKELAKIAGDKLKLFFKSVNKFERVQDDGREFRRLARATFEPDPFAQFIKAATAVKKGGIAKSRVYVAWKEAEPVQAAS